MRGYDREKNLDREIYYSDHYFSYGQLWSFTEQIYHISQFKPQRLIEVGVGNGFVSGFFKTMGIHVKTFDINPNLFPDIVAPLHDLSDFVHSNEFDLISCCEVLEHIPFEEFENLIGQFSTLSERLFLTLPVHSKYIGFGGLIRLPKFLRWVGIWLRLPMKSRQLFDSHFWEIDYDDKTSKKEILGLLNKYYWKVETGLFKANPYHRYFSCSESRNLKKS
ncbi:MAG: methyltransferase domain-containing protein [Chloroflexi bacterium]|nr:methyltransferase domain-containing protein [Chloroflexota bacterium]